MSSSSSQVSDRKMIDGLNSTTKCCKKRHCRGIQHLNPPTVPAEDTHYSWGGFPWIASETPPSMAFMLLLLDPSPTQKWLCLVLTVAKGGKVVVIVFLAPNLIPVVTLWPFPIFPWHLTDIAVDRYFLFFRFRTQVFWPEFWYSNSKIIQSL